MPDRKIYVYCNMDNEDILVGYLWVNIKGQNETSTFQYTSSWVENAGSFSIDPALYLTTTPQYAENPLFGVFTDCSPDRWGRLLMNRFEKTRAKEESRQPRRLNNIDFMMLVNDEARQGALRFKADPNGEFMFPPRIKPIPPLVRLPELLSAAEKINEHIETSEDIRLLLEPGSSLGGARPKASVIDNDGDLCIAKFPKKDDNNNIVLWEAVALTLAKNAGINVPSWQVQEISGKSVIIIKRFDRNKTKRIPFVSAMTLLGAKDGDNSYSYQNIADIIRQYGSDPKADMIELWRRIVFSVLISNTDDHLRNHGFIRIDDKGWRLSPVYDINPSSDNISALSTMIAEGDYSATLENALSVAEYFGLLPEAANRIISEVEHAVSKWKNVAKQFGIRQAEINHMEVAFKV